MDSVDLMKPCGKHCIFNAEPSSNNQLYAHCDHLGSSSLELKILLMKTAAALLKAEGYRPLVITKDKSND